ncbi:SDR family oxidoreductase [Acinetobacter baumannii]|uniref:SDR family NAD(P)-dependent oxidoreductase n=1 Tax=Acinetobacter baumannii TaxID=470 RepID=UPI0010C7FE66|nr:SDR family oxidoreductase [Acinetobacter baumannii]MBE4722894.1 SDR family oxidoreductase [Acinetobacter baumannii]MBE4724590.1 SDR family oxidoreductase [Acinetobacter baumannii]MDV7515469.1 SDR family oxidoreductase [Acinetobacter baumannii]MDV7561510.1 SDR family oxidoreductase [Acinetobacter baumannii]QCP39749.1 SDR family oxidoreductase [Acinetobacter baumannii]
MSLYQQIAFDLPEAVIITGTSSGLGEAVATSLTKANVKVFGLDIAGKTAALEALENYEHFQGDITKPESWSALTEKVKKGNFKHVGLVPCAAITDIDRILDVTPERIKKVFDVNILGTIQALQAALPLMLPNKQGSIVLIGSICATFGEQGLPIYSASKAAVRELARTTSLDYARDGIKVNIVSPGPMMAGLFKRHVESVNDPSFHPKRANRQPYGKILEVDDVARTILFLLSSGSSALLGADLMADAGLTTGFDFYS